LIGQTLGHYRIDARLGAGGMGVVYRAHDTRLERTVAVKLIGEEIPADDTARQRLLSEARSASALNHPHVCTVHEVGEADGHMFIVMEYVEGRPLRDLVPHDGLSIDVVIRYGMQIADALAHAHQRGIVHRDLKAANVVITPEGRAKVLDFGLSKRLPTEELSEAQTRTKRSLTEAGTEAGHVVGTLHYLAPESLHGQPADRRTDIWALGVLLHNMASGGLPFEGKTRYEVTAAILGQPPAPLPERVPAGLRAVIQRCLAKEPSQRYQQVVEVRAALEAVQSGSVALPADSPRQARPRWMLPAAAGALALVGALAAFHWLGARDGGIQSIAVLPFANVGGNPDNEYLSDGITESLIGSLSHLPKLKMIAFGSVLRYKGRPVDAAAIAHDLGVGAIVIGRVTQRGDSLSIGAELVDTRDGSRIWGDQYDAKPTTVLSIQQEISKQISEQLRSDLTGEERRRVTNPHTENTEAYQLYLKGRYFWYKFTPEGYAKSLEFYRKAIEKDPNYAPAYAGIAAYYAAMTWEGQLPPKDGFREVEAALMKALSLDDTLALAHWGVAEQLRFARDWNWPAAEAEYQRAIALDPQDPIIRRFHSQFLRALGRWDEAIAEMKRAMEVDPLGVETNKGLAYTYYWARRYDEAIEQCKKTLEIDANYGPAHELLAEVYGRKGMYKEAIAEEQRVLVLAGDNEGAEAMAQDFARLGYEPTMRSLYQGSLDSLKEALKERYVSPISFAIGYAKLGDKNEAFAWLEKAYAERSPWLTLLKADPDFDNLRSDPRFAEIVRRVGLPL